VATYTPRLGLKNNDGSDPFKRQDFVDNNNRLDATPGMHVCTSSSRPTWAGSQAGRAILETDTGSIYIWSGTAFNPLTETPLSWAGGLNIGATLSPNANANYNFITLTAPKPGYLFISGAVRLACADNTIGASAVSVIVDNAPVGLAGQLYVQFVSRDNTGYFDHREIPIFALAPISAGTHTVGARVSVSGYPNSIFVGAARGMAFLART
jgi:hypothetical protein